MIETSQILSVADKIAEQFHPERIILFGSYAYGTPNEDSDVDLLVVMPFEGRTARQAIEIRGAIRAVFPMDLIPITPEKLKYRLEIEDFFLREVVEKERCFMKPITLEWIDKAEGDWDVAERAWLSREKLVCDNVCFHSQECTEKYLKARVVEADVALPKTHNLPHLLLLVLPLEPGWDVLEPSLLGLKAFGGSIVYPGKKADKTDAQNALGYCREVREAARRSFGLPL